jgi:hypothetical protein
MINNPASRECLDSKSPGFHIFPPAHHGPLLTRRQASQPRHSGVTVCRAVIPFSPTRQHDMKAKQHSKPNGRGQRISRKHERAIIFCLCQSEARGRYLNQPDVFNGKNPKTYVQMNGGYIRARQRRIAKILIELGIIRPFSWIERQ